MFPKIGVPPQIIHFNRVFHYKPSILGYHYFWKHPYVDHRWKSSSLPHSCLDICWVEEPKSCHFRIPKCEVSTEGWKCRMCYCSQPPQNKIEDIKVKALHISCKKTNKLSATMNACYFIFFWSKHAPSMVYLPTFTIKINHSCRYIYNTYVYMILYDIIHGTSGKVINPLMLSIQSAPSLLPWQTLRRPAAHPSLLG